LRLVTPIDGFRPKNHGEGGSVVELRPLPQRFALLKEKGKMAIFDGGYQG
jgi:hypothetical protein